MKQSIGIFERMIRWMIGLLGFTSVAGCFGGFKTEYGTPHADYKLIGEVQSEEGVKLSGIRVVYSLDGDWSHPYAKDTTYTNSDGKYVINSRLWLLSQESALKFEDVDGPSNGGAFSTLLLPVNPDDFEKTEKGDGHWYKGVFTLTANVTMKLEHDD